MILKIVLGNIKNSFKSFRKIYILLVASQMISILSLFFVYGVFSSYSLKMQELDSESYTIGTSFEGANVGELKNCLPKVLDKIEKKLNFFWVSVATDEFMVSSHTEYHRGEYFISKTVQENIYVEKGRMITDEDEKNHARVLLSARLDVDKVGDVIDVSGTEFEVIGLDSSGMGHVEIPFSSCPDNADLYLVIFKFKELPTQRDYNVIKDTFESAFGERLIMGDFKLKNEEAIISYRTNIIISVAIVVISALNTCLLFGYIVTQRRKQMAVYGIIGATRGRRLAINEIEIMLISFVTVLLGFVIFRLGLENVITRIYESSAELYSVEVYLIMMTLYIISILIFTVMVLMWMNKNKLADMLRRTRND